MELNKFVSITHITWNFDILLFKNDTNIFLLCMYIIYCTHTHTYTHTHTHTHTYTYIGSL
jgi:hypothetical protein